MKTIILTILALLLASTSYASGIALNNGKITKLSITDVAYMSPATGTFEDPDDCQGDGDNSVDKVVLNTSHAHFNHAYATLLAAQMSGKNLTIWVNGCVDRWGSRFPAIGTVHLMD